MMRWTKGKPANKAPLGVPVLARYGELNRPRYAVVIRTRGPDQSYSGSEPTPSYQWAYQPGGAMADEPARIWQLPEGGE